MTLEKLKIVPQPPSRLGEIEVLFNPTAYSISKSVTWNPPENSNGGEQSKTQRALNAPILTFGGGDSRQLTLELMFDVTEPINGRIIDDVRQETNKILALTRIERLEPPRPPTCLCRGRTDLRSGKVIEINGVGKQFSGQYYVTATSHRYRSSGNYTTHLSVQRNAL
jgi:Contractile injection system tube protein